MKPSPLCLNMLLAALLILAAGCQSKETKPRAKAPAAQTTPASEEPEPEGREGTIFLSVPSGATCTVDGTRLGLTPCAAVLPNKKTVTVIFEKRGFRKETYTIDRDLDGWGSSYTFPLRRP